MDFANFELLLFFIKFSLRFIQSKLVIFVMGLYINRQGHLCRFFYEYTVKFSSDAKANASEDKY